MKRPARTPVFNPTRNGWVLLQIAI